MNGPAARTKRPLSGRYQLYKQKTQKFVEWLFVHAKRSTDATSVAITQTGSATGCRKGVRINVRGLVELACSVVADKVLVPPTILESIQQAVRYRKEYAA